MRAGVRRSRRSLGRSRSDVPPAAFAMAATNKIVAEWLPREDLPTPRTLTCSVLDTRHRGRVVFFAGVRDEASQQTIQLIFRGSSTPGGGMADDELRWLKRRLRPGDQIRAEIFATERATDESVGWISAL